jgi:nitroimidazol reductase NimA-like FMN-containing flavoprotein (pyridoxamine 5'-phosphate oxidase superfamily)
MATSGIFEPSGPDGVALSERECRRLLATRTLGRVGLTSGALPMIMPVEYLYENGVITFRTEHDTKLRAAIHGAVLAFEVDAYDSSVGQGWSVHVLGRATVLTVDNEVAPLPTFDAGGVADPRRHYVRLHCEIVSGRRLSSSQV